MNLRKTLCLSGSLLAASATVSAQKPNIIYILADDLGYGDLSCYGQTKFQTPNADALAQNGIRFTDFYSGSPVSSPSRCILLTGLHSGHAVVRRNKSEALFPMPANTQTIAHILKNAGYKTACTGKWGLGLNGSISSPNKMGFDYFFGYNSQYNAHVSFPDTLMENDKVITYPENFNNGKKTWSAEEVVKHAKQFITNNSKQPFFLYLSMTQPHAELVLPEKYMKNFVGKYPEKPFLGVAAQLYGAQENPHAAYAGMVTWMDNQIGDLKQLLKSLKIDENTIIVITSDNGPHREGGGDPAFFNSAGGLRGIKRDLYEGGIREPFIVSWPAKIKKGSVSNRVSASYDILPTLCDVAGIPTPKNVDGISLYPTMLGKKSKAHDFLYFEFPEVGDYKAVRMGNWKAVQLTKQNVSTMELYDLAVDMAEKNNVASLHPDIIKQAESIIKQEHVDLKQ